MASTYAFDLAVVGPDMYSGWTPAGNYFVQPTHKSGPHGGPYRAVFMDRKRKQTVLGTFDTVRDAKIAVQTDAMIRNPSRRSR